MGSPFDASLCVKTLDRDIERLGITRAAVSHPRLAAHGRRHGFRALLLTCLAGLGLGACTQTQPYQLVDERPPRAERVLLMPVDVMVLEVGATGLPLPREQWTNDVRDGFATTAARVLRDRNLELVRYPERDHTVVPYRPNELPALRLQRAVMRSVLAHHYGDGDQLPADASDQWNLGDSVAPLRERYDANVALFITYRQANASTGRAVLNVISTVLSGALQPSSQSVAFASLVDLQTGQFIWTNVLQSQGFDANAPDQIADRARELLTEMPL